MEFQSKTRVSINVSYSIYVYEIANVNEDPCFRLKLDMKLIDFFLLYEFLACFYISSS